MPLVFISYRRRDTAESMTGLYYALKLRMHPDEIFVDQKGIPPGADFPSALARAATASRSLLALIGPRWMDVPADAETDYVVLEIGGALEADALVIPVLFEGVPMPDHRQLPEGLAELAYRNAWPITRERSLRDINDLVEHLAARLGIDVDVTAAAPSDRVLGADLITGLAASLLLALILVVVV